MTPEPLLLLGTSNRKKGAELADLFQGARLGIRCRTLADVENPITVVEDGSTFAENAAKKATGQARHLGLWVLAEDSGLVVDALGGAPGVFSARYCGPDATDASNNRRLLAELAGTPPEKRSAGYVCHMTLADPAGTIRAESEGTCRGRIAIEPRGTHGFGYDPLFELLEYHRTFGELGPNVKSVLSHRASAARRLIPALRRLIDCGVLRT